MTSPVEVLVRNLVDYAGLFPPAGLEMADAVAEYARRGESGDAWILGSFVVPAARLEELAEQRRAAGLETEWPVSVLVGGDPGVLPDPVPAGLSVRSLESRAAAVEDIERWAAAAPSEIEHYVEIPWDTDPMPFLEALRNGGLRAKLRCGGVRPELIPPVEAVARFLVAAAAAEVSWKATAGLHHPLRGVYRLTYEPDPPVAALHGFLNVFLAAALVHFDPPPSSRELIALLEERSADAFTVRESGIEWRGRVFTPSRIAAARTRVAMSYGSCSFAEPVDELRALRWLV